MEGSKPITDTATLEIINSLRLQIDCGFDRMTPSPKEITCFTDGSCTRNGQPGAKAAFGVYIVRGDTVLVKKGVKLSAEEPQTNQRAELQGLFYALTYMAEGGLAGKIYSDSKYSIDCLKSWAPKWVQNGWRKADKKPVLHDDILKPMYELWLGLKENVELLHVDAHTGKTDFLSRGNDVADRLANDAVT
jgi:ribonuclease HI